MLDVGHSAAEGTTVRGTGRGDGSAEVLRRHGLRWSASCLAQGEPGFWYVPHSRDRAPRRGQIDRLADDLRAAGFEVTVTVSDTARSTADVEADRADRAAARAAGLTGRAGRLSATAGGLHEQAHRLADAIPFGQPILAGHHSQGRDTRYRERMGRTMDKAVATSREADEVARRAGAAEANQSHHLSAGATLRRIDRLEADQRALERRTAARPGNAYLGDVATERARLADELTYWRAHLATLEAAGTKLWSREDFLPGDRVNGSCTVVRVNPKSITVQHDVWGAGHTHTLPYSKVRTMSRPIPKETPDA